MVDKLIFTNEEASRIREIVKYYELTKELLIFGEQVDPQNRTLAQAINELRNCLDHLMRVIAYKLGLRKADKDDNYAELNLEKAFGHVYRAAYDTLDWVSLTLKDRIVDELQGFSLEAIRDALPEYYTNIKPRFEQIISEEITKLRVEKDVAAASEENLVMYGKVTAELKELFQTIINRKSALVDYQTRLERSRRRQRILRIVESVGVGIVVGLLVWLLV